jgi:hypothetical protein
VLPILQSNLPYSLPLLGRLRFHHRSPASHVVATFPTPTTSEAVPQCFAVAFLDRTRRPETECWIFASGEVPGRCQLSSPAQHCDECKAAVLSLVDTIAKLDLPGSIHDTAMVEFSPSLASALSGEVLLIGQLHETCTKIIQQAMTGANAKPPVSGIDVPYVFYLFQPSTLPEPRALPVGLRWGQVRPQDFALVRSRTLIPRQDATLALLPSLAIFPDNEVDASPVAWAFLGVDGSLTSLHTEPEYRGKGLAKILTGKIFREKGFTDQNLAETTNAESKATESDEEAWFHADVALDNKSSRRVCQGLGGKESWIVHWIRIDLTKAQDLSS